MKKQDLFFILFICALFLPFLLSKVVLQAYTVFNQNHGMVMSFLKFALLATMGEALGLRIKKGVYNEPGFGLLPRAFTWGLFGLLIKLAFVVFASGTPSFIEYMGIQGAGESMNNGFNFTKLITAFGISLSMNLIFSPVFMTLHKITDIHIVTNGGTIRGYFSPIKVNEILSQINWDIHYNFVLKKTIPLFWVPAHTLTFLLPPDYRILFAALLGVALGLILSIASIRGNK